MNEALDNYLTRVNGRWGRTKQPMGRQDFGLSRPSNIVTPDAVGIRVPQFQQQQQDGTDWGSVIGEGAGLIKGLFDKKSSDPGLMKSDADKIGWHPDNAQVLKDRLGMDTPVPLPSQMPQLGRQFSNGWEGGKEQPQRFLGAKFGGWRALGGQIGDDQTVIVGENGPEAVRRKNGKVEVMPLPNQTVMGGGQVQSDQPDVPMQTQASLDAIDQKIANNPQEQARRRTLLGLQAGNPMPGATQDTAPPTTDEMPVGAEPSLEDKYKQQYAELENRDYGTKQHPGKDSLKHHNFLDVLKGIGIGALQGIRNSGGGSLENILGGALGGAAGGGVAEGVDRNWNQKTLDEIKRPEILQRIGEQQQIQKNDANTAWINARPELTKAATDAKTSIAANADATKRYLAQKVTDRLNDRADIKAGTAKPVINAKGQMELEFLNVDSKGQRRPNELVKGADGQPIEVPGEEGVQWKDPNTGNVFTLKGKQAANAETNAGRLGETKAQNKITNALNDQKFAQVKDAFNKTFGLRQQMFQAVQDARAKGDEAKAQASQLQLDKYTKDTEKMKAHLEEALTKGDLTKDQYDELMQFYGADWNK